MEVPAEHGSQLSEDFLGAGRRLRRLVAGDAFLWMSPSKVGEQTC